VDLYEQIYLNQMSCVFYECDRLLTVALMACSSSLCVCCCSVCIRSQLSAHRVENPSDVVEADEQVYVKVIEISVGSILVFVVPDPLR
jgi:hypothetical protein